MWHAGYCLSVHLTCSLADLVRGRHVLELGSGTGIVGLTCACLGAASVTLTDLPGQLAHLRTNIATAQPLWARTCPAVAAAALPFGDAACFAQALADNGRTWDVLIGADIGYDPSLHGPIAATVAAFFAAAEEVEADGGSGGRGGTGPGDDGDGRGDGGDGVDGAGGAGGGGEGRKRAPRMAVLTEEVRWTDIYKWYDEELHAAAALGAPPWALTKRERVDGLPAHKNAIEVMVWM